MADVTNALDEASYGLNNISNYVKCVDIAELSEEMLMALDKEILSQLLLGVSGALSCCKGVLETASGKVDELKNQVIDLQNAKIEYFEQKLSPSAQATLGNDMESYAGVVNNNQSAANEMCGQVTRTFVQEEVTPLEDRRTNVMVFGMRENENEDIGNNISDLLNAIGVKPYVLDCIRIGRTAIGGSPRPVKVLLKSAEASRQVLMSARLLKGTPEFKNVYLAPDRSPEERVAHRKTVQILKLKISGEADMFHSIHGSYVVSTPRSYVVPQTPDDHKKVDTPDIQKKKIDGEADLHVSTCGSEVVDKPEPRSNIVCQTADGEKIKKAEMSEMLSFFNRLNSGKLKI